MPDLIQLTQSQYISVCHQLPNPTEWLNGGRKQTDIYIQVLPDTSTNLVTTDSAIYETPHYLTRQDLLVIRFRINYKEKQIPFWEPTQTIQIRPHGGWEYRV